MQFQTYVKCRPLSIPTKMSVGNFLDFIFVTLATLNAGPIISVPGFSPILESKEATLERADLTLQLLMFVTAEKERKLFIIFFLSSFCQLLSPQF